MALDPRLCPLSIHDPEITSTAWRLAETENASEEFFTVRRVDRDGVVFYFGPTGRLVYLKSWPSGRATDSAYDALTPMLARSDIINTRWSERVPEMVEAIERVFPELKETEINER